MDQRNCRHNKGYNCTLGNKYTCKEARNTCGSHMDNVVECPGTMEAPVDCMPIAMAYVPWQRWDEVFTGEAGLAHGTIFPELVKPWWTKCGSRM